MLPTPNASLKGPFGTLLIVPAGIEAGELQRFQVFSPHGGAGSAAQMAAGQILQGVAGDGSAVQAIRGLYVNRWGHLTGLAPDALVARLRRDLADGIMFAAFYIPSDDFTLVATTQKPDTAMLLADPPGGPIAWSPAQRIAAMLRRVPANMPEAMQAQVAALFTPQAIALMALMMAVLAVAQLYVAGEIVDSILIAFAWGSAGWAGLVALKRFIGAVIDAAGETALPPIEADAKAAADALGLLGIAFITAVVARARDQENIFAKDEAPAKEPPPVKKPAPVAKGWKDYPSTAKPTDAAAAKPGSGSTIAAETAGPGTWSAVNESMSARAAAYQMQITGRTGESYIVRGVKFDGFESGTLLDAKGPGYASFVKDGEFRSFFQGQDSLLDQAQRQVTAADGVPITWHVAEAPAADAMRALLSVNRVKGITVVYTPSIP